MRTGSIVLVTTVVAAAIVVGPAVIRSQPPLPELAVVGYDVVGSVPVSAALDDYTLRVRVAHGWLPGGMGAARVTVRVASRNPSVQIIDGEASVGSIRPGTTATSIDTVTVRKARGVPLNKAHVSWTVSGARDLIVPEAWAGTWDLQITYRDAETGDVTAIERTRNDIRPDEAFGLGPAAHLARCTGRTTGYGIEIQCAVKVREPLCDVDGTGDLSAVIDGDALTGSARWSSSMTAGCGGSPHAGETIEIAGTRASADYTTPVSPETSLLRKFVTHMAVVSLGE